MLKKTFKTNNAIRLAVFSMALLFLHLSGCKKDPIKTDPIETNTVPKKGIIGGSPTLIGNVPYQAGIYYNGNFNAGGVILSDRWILTAAHVVTIGTNTQMAAGDVTVRVGSDNLYSGASYTADQIIRYPDYTGANQIYNDIALIHLSTPITFNDNVEFIPYATPNEDPQITVDMLAKVSGWGTIAYNSSTGVRTNPSYLFAADVKISSIAPSFIYTSSTTSNQQSPCYGDSGGPLVVEIAGLGKILVGVVNGWGDCNVGAKGYARTSSYASWIRQTTNIVYYNRTKIVSFLKNDCQSTVQYPIEVNYTVPAGTYSSTVSQADADQQALAAINQNGQQYANTHGLCYAEMSSPRDSYNLPRGNSGSRYLEHLYWNPALSPADSHVKIELLERRELKDSKGRYLGVHEYLLTETIGLNVPNTGQLLNGLDSDLWNMSSFPSSGQFLVRITAVNSGITYLSYPFDLEKDED